MKPVKKVPLEGLDASRFSPVSGDEARAFIKGMGGLFRRSWDSPRRIPNAKLPRIQLIDRAMVGLGLITPEELAAAHEVGEKMDQARGDVQAVREMADAAVALAREERETLKKRKKAEAAERKAQQVRNIAERRTTDIIFLGRGVSRDLADRRTNVEKLQSLDLPLLATPADVARALELTIPRLRWLAYHTEASRTSHYVHFEVPKKSGGTRMLSSPHKTMAQSQQWILRNILDRIPAHNSAHGFLTGRSTLTNALPHVSMGVVVNVDLKEFFPSITFPRINGLFQGFGYSPAVGTILALICTECPRRKVEYDGKVYFVSTGPRALPQGACTSPALSNLVSRKLDARLSGLCARLGWNYTRYADDMTFSSTGKTSNEIGYLLARVRHVVEDEGFSINGKKTRVQRQSCAQSVTGIVVNERPGVERKTVRRVRAILHRAAREGLQAQNRAGLPDFARHLDGMIAYISMVNPRHGQGLRSAWKSLHCK